MARRRSYYEEIFDAVSSVLVEHEEFAVGLQRLHQVFRRCERGKEPVCIGIFGESRTGKTRLLEEFLKTYPSIRHPEGVELPVLRVTTASRPTVIGMLESMLRCLGDPEYSKGKETQKRDRLVILLKAAKTRVIVVDEIQHFVDRRSSKVLHEVADALKLVSDEAGVGLITAGVERAERVLIENAQLDGRFLTPIRLSRFNWSKEAHRKQFVGIAMAFHKSISRYVELPSFDNADMAFRLYVGCGGLMGYVVMFLGKLVWDIGEKGKRTITLNDMSNAYAESVARQRDVGVQLKPFNKCFSVDPKDQSQLDAARRIGHEEAPDTRSTERSGKKPPKTTRSRRTNNRSVNNTINAS